LASSRAQCRSLAFRGSVRTVFLGAVERAGIQNVRFHDCRHTFASWLTMRGRPLKEVQELLGHASITQTER
jgi:integrase